MSPNESNLERDYATLLEFDRGIASYEAQPLQLSFLDRKGRLQPGWPDFLVSYSADSSRRPVLVDVKYRSEIFEKWFKLKPRLKAARSYALERGWDYSIQSDVEIRIPRLLATRFLLTYRHMPVSHADIDAVIEVLSGGAMTTPTHLLEELSGDKWRRAELIPAIWHLVATFRVGADLDQPVHMNSAIWLGQVP